MRVGEAAKLFAANAAWRTFGFRSAGRAVISGLSSPDENNRSIAGMFLVQAGRRAVPLLRRELEHPRNLPLTLRIIGDLGAREFLPELERYTAADDPAVARAARDAIESMGDDRAAGSNH